MSELLDFYKQQAAASRSTIPWLAILQDEGLRELTHYGFPTRQDEDWKYTLVDNLLTQRFAKAQAAVVKNLTAPASDMPYTQQRFILQNGIAKSIDDNDSTWPEGVLVQPLSQALEQQADKIKPYLGRLLHHEHGLQALNTAMLTTGIFVYIPAGVCIEQPIVLSHWQDKGQQAVYNRCLILAETGSQATIIEEFQGQDDCCYLTNTISEIWISADAKLCHYKIQRESKQAYHIGHVAVELNQSSQFDSHVLSLGGKLARSDLSVYLQAADATCLLNGIYAPVDGQHMDHHTTIHHLVPCCHSEQDYKGVLAGRSRAVFNGKIIVAKDAQHTQARQQNKNLLLSAQAEIDSKPQLDIFADDVVCTHGATVGQLDEEALFYLATRGISRAEASNYLVHAFAADNLRLLPHPLFADWIRALLNQQLR